MKTPCPLQATSSGECEKSFVIKIAKPYAWSAHMLDIQIFAAGYEILENPVLSSFNANWKAVATRVGTAYALPEDMGPFAAMSGDTDVARSDFVRLVQSRKSPVIIAQQNQIVVPSGLTALQHMRGVQMVPMVPIVTTQDAGFDVLSDDDAPAMLHLATMTKPGPFALRTNQLGEFIGIRVNGELVAMAGQRMRFPGWIEISGVCVHPEFRNRGMARQLVTAMIDKIVQSGAQPFLHTFADNATAIALYRSLGFEIRTEMDIALIAYDEALPKPAS